MDNSLFFGISGIAYIIAMIIYITYLAFKNNTIGLIATTVTVVGFISQTIAFFMRWSEFAQLGQMGLIRSIPLTNLYESLVFFVWCLIFGYLLIEYKYKNKSFGAFITPIAGMAISFISISGMSKAIQPLVPALQSNWLLAHVTMSFFAYAAFAISFATALMYMIIISTDKKSGSYVFWTVILGVFICVILGMAIDFLVFKVFTKSQESLVKSLLFKSNFRNSSVGIAIFSYVCAIGLIAVIWNFGDKIRNLVMSFHVSEELLDELTYKCIAIGFPVFTLGGLIFGAIWADQAWGRYWSWDPKETWSLITWFVYAFFLHARYMKGWRGYKIAAVSVIGFISTIFTYLGVNLLLSGLHSYGSM